MRRYDLKLNIRRTVAFFLVLVFAVCLAPAAYADGVGGDCGEGVKWSLFSGTLVISGKGEMADYGEYTVCRRGIVVRGAYARSKGYLCKRVKDKEVVLILG